MEFEWLHTSEISTMVAVPKAYAIIEEIKEHIFSTGFFFRLLFLICFFSSLPTVVAAIICGKKNKKQKK